MSRSFSAFLLCSISCEKQGEDCLLLVFSKQHDMGLGNREDLVCYGGTNVKSRRRLALLCCCVAVLPPIISLDKAARP